MTKARLQHDLPLYNPWWDSNRPPSAEDTPYRESRRSDYENHFKAVLDERFYALVGPHGAGKTSTLYQIIHDLIDEGEADPEHIVYVSLDNPLYGIDDNRFLIDIYDWYSSYIHRNQVEDGQKAYFLFDDVHHIDTWAEQTETLLNRTENAHFALTLPVEDEHLNQFGHFSQKTHSVLFPPKFYDYTNFEFDVPKANKDDLIYPIRQALGCKRGVDNPTIVDECLTLQNVLAETDASLPSLVDKYLFKSGLRDESGDASIKQALQLTIFRDVRQYYAIEDPGDLYTLCVLVAQNPTSEFQFSRLTEQLETDRRTIRKYLSILQDFFILSHSYKWGYERHRSLRMYLRDPRFVTALNTYSETTPQSRTDELRRRLTEGVVYDHLRRLAYYLNEGTDVDMPVRYWNENGHTVEFVIDVQENPIPIVLTARRGEDAAADAVAAFIDTKDKASRGIVTGEDITNPYATDDSVLRLPLWMLLYLC